MEAAALRARPAVAADVPALLDRMALFNALEGIAWSPASGEPALRALLADASLGHVGLFEAGGAVAGYFVLTWGYDLEWAGRDAWLTELFLDEGLRGRGLGARCLDAVEAAARGAGARALHLMVRPENDPALRLYRGAGFEAPPRVCLSKPLPSRDAGTSERATRA